MESVHIFSAWFQVDLRPLRQALLNTVSKWGNMYKQHLVDHVTSRWVAEHTITFQYFSIAHRCGGSVTLPREGMNYP